MPYTISLSGKSFTFKDVKEVLAKANEVKSGDTLAGIAAESDLERIAAKEVLANLTVRTIRENPVVPYEEDEVTRINQDSIDPVVYDEIKNLTMAELREKILSYSTSEDDIKRLTRGLTSEVVAGVCKLMSNMDLVYAANKVRVTATCNTTIGKRGCLSTRLQPNHTSDNPEGMTASLFEGLSYGCGDALLGINPVNDTVSSLSELLKRLDEVKNKFEIPTQICVLGHITTQIEAVRKGAPADMIFQSIAGSQKGNTAFGFGADTVREAQALLRDRGTAKGPNVMYFETGQGSELSSDSHYGADQVTMETDLYSLPSEILADARAGKYDKLERGQYKKPLNRWKTEELVYNIVKKLYWQYKVVYQYHPYYLKTSKGSMSYDVYICGLKTAIEYQGKQHFEPVEYFGGKEHYERQAERDKLKMELSEANGVKLIYINYWEDVTPDLIIEKVGVDPRKECETENH